MRKIPFIVPFAAGVAYILFWVGYAVAKVGTLPDNVGEFTWSLPPLMFIFVGAPFFLGLVAGIGASED